MPEPTWTSETRYVPRPTKRNRAARPELSPEQQRLAEDLEARALALRAASDGELSIREAVDLAATQLGIEGPQTHPDQTEKP